VPFTHNQYFSKSACEYTLHADFFMGFTGRNHDWAKARVLLPSFVPGINAGVIDSEIELY
jgi:hypothetical protein